MLPVRGASISFHPAIRPAGPLAAGSFEGLAGRAGGVAVSGALRQGGSRGTLGGGGGARAPPRQSDIVRPEALGAGTAFNL